MKKIATIVFACTLLLAVTGKRADAQRITVTIAGNGSAGFGGDSGPGRTSMISGPKDICMDAANNIYFIDKANLRVRKLSAKGVITTIAGGGSSYADGIPATAAAIDPNYMCMDASGNIYITTGCQVREIDAATGRITTVAGVGYATSGFGGDWGLATAATLNYPQGICINSAGDIYIADRWNNRIRKITAATGVITTIAGTGLIGYMGDSGTADTARLNSPIAICLNAAGDVIFSDQEPDCPNFDFSVIRKIDAATGIISTIAGPGVLAIATYGLLAEDAELGTITGLCTDETGNIYCDEMSCSCRKLNISTDTLELVGGDFYTQGYSDYITSGAANMNVPYGLCIDHAGNVYVADSMNNRIRKLIQLTNTPEFAFGHAQSIDANGGLPFELDTLMAVADIDASQVETWVAISAPAHGTLTGFPASRVSVGVNYLNFAHSGMTYVPFSAYVGADSFRVEVSDGTGLKDTTTIYVTVGAGITTSANNVVSNKAINIYPSPASSVLNIEWTNPELRNSDIVITDVSGRVVYSAAMVDNKTGSMQIDISGIQQGVYFVKIGETEVRKFTKL